MALKGTRVLAIISAKDGVILSLGEGVYDGDATPPEDIAWVPGMLNPKIILDSGKVVWGCECWWGPVDAVKDKFPPTWKWELVDIDDIRNIEGKPVTPQPGAKPAEAEASHG